MPLLKRLRDRIAAHRRAAKPIAEKLAPGPIEDFERDIAPPKPPRARPLRGLIELHRLYKTLKGTNMATSANVEVKSAWSSKINWTLAVTLAINALAFFGVIVPTDVKEAVMMVATAAGTVIAWVLRTWFTTTITPAAANKV